MIIGADFFYLIIRNILIQRSVVTSSNFFVNVDTCTDLSLHLPVLSHRMTNRYVCDSDYKRTVPDANTG